MKYSYQYLTVVCLKPRTFQIDQIREAVEYMKALENNGVVTKLQASVSVRIGRIGLLSQNSLELAEILGKTPKQVWELFDQLTTKEIQGAERTWRMQYRG